MYCNKCGKEIEANAKFCNHCGTVNNSTQTKTINYNNVNVKPKKKVYQQWWFWLIIVLLALMIIGIGGGSSTPIEQTSTNSSISNTNNFNKQENTVQKEEKDKKTEKEEILKVNYEVLHKDYMDNPIAADEKYRGKILQLTGEVYDIDREISGNTYITFYIDFLEDVRITFKKSEESKVAKLKKGQKVTIKGKCTGTLLSTTVALNDCEIIE